MNIFKKQWEFIRPIWKILVVILIVQIIGGAIGKASNIYSDLFMSIWIGGAVSSFPGFLLGFVWQFNTDRASFKNRDTLYITLVIDVMALVMTAIALFFPVEQFTSLIKGRPY